MTCGTCIDQPVSCVRVLKSEVEMKPTKSDVEDTGADVDICRSCTRDILRLKGRLYLRLVL